MNSRYKLQATNYELIVLVGPTSSGKSELAIKLARRFNGEIISADSRQIYKGMDLGTGKVPGSWTTSLLCDRTKVRVFTYKDVLHHLIDFVSPRSQFSAARYQSLVQKTIKDINRRGKLPIICGGTMHWVDAVIYDQNIPDVKPNAKLRKKLEKQSADALYRKLMDIDPVRARSIDKHNKRRLIRALEIVITTGRPVPTGYKLPTTSFDVLWLGLSVPQKTLDKRIKKRLIERIELGMIKEVSKLRAQGLSWKRLESFGLEYRFVSLYLQKKVGYDEMIEKLYTAIRQYSRRQMTWWKRNKEINWIKDHRQAVRLVSSRTK